MDFSCVVKLKSVYSGTFCASSPDERVVLSLSSLVVCVCVCEEFNRCSMCCERRYRCPWCWFWSRAPPATPPEGLVCHDGSASLLGKVLEGRTANHRSVLFVVYWLTCDGYEWLRRFSVSTAVELHSDMSYLLVFWAVFLTHTHFKGFILFYMNCSFVFSLRMACFYWSMVCYIVNLIGS